MNTEPVAQWEPIDSTGGSPKRLERLRIAVPGSGIGWLVQDVDSGSIAFVPDIDGLWLAPQLLDRIEHQPTGTQIEVYGPPSGA